MRPLCRALILLALSMAGAAYCRAQQPLPDGPPGGQGSQRPAPGAMAPFDNPHPGSIIGGSPRSMRPRVPITTRPRGPAHVAPSLEMPAPEAARGRPAYVPDAWSILFEIDREGPPEGLTWEVSVDRLVEASIVLRAKALDIPQAQADVLTAGMHANPIVYFDRQLIGYRPYNSVTNPGGPSQYDFNVAYPVDLSRKRQARVDVACSAERVVEALYQDAVRLEIDRLAKAYVDVLAAELAYRTIADGLARLDVVRKEAAAAPQDPRDDDYQRRQLARQQHSLALALADAQATVTGSKRNLSLLINLSTERAAELQLRGTIRERSAPPPPLATLVDTALANRPDLAAYRLGLRRAHADVRLSQANVLPDVFLLYQPFTYQDNSPFNAPSSRSWAVGATVVLPIFDRNQGNIRRAQYNASQSRLELEAIEQRVRAEVEGAYDEYQVTKQSIEEIEHDLVPDVQKTLSDNLERFRQGRLDAPAYLSALNDMDDLGRQYRDLLVRHRRSMLNINTVVGVRVMP
jgi:outer membrane protein, heavy metal efflux system